MNDDVRFERLIEDLLADSAPAHAPERLRTKVGNVTRAVWSRPRWLALVTSRPMRLPSGLAVGSPTARSAFVVASTLALILAVTSAVAAGASLIEPQRLAVRPDGPSPRPSVVTAPSATTSPSVTASPSATDVATQSPAGPPWMTGRELMDSLTAAFGYQWSPAAHDAQVFESGPVRVSAPLDRPATVEVRAVMDDKAEVAQHSGRIAQALAPDVASWIQDQIAQGLDAYMQGLDPLDPIVTEYATSRHRDSMTRTATGGQVDVVFVDEQVIGDELYISFVPDPPPTRGLEPGGGLVLYPSGDRIWAANPDGTNPGLFVPSTRTPHGVDVLGWSADGSRLFYRAGVDLFAVDADGSQTVRVGAVRSNPLCPVGVADDDCQPNEDIAISPDGTRLAYSLQEGRESDIHTIAVLDVASGQVSRLDPTRAPGVDMPSWSPDGTRLVFGCPGIGPRADGICQVNVDGSDLRRILPSMAGDISDLQWSCLLYTSPSPRDS